MSDDAERLIYVSGNIAFFSSDPKPSGDDWNDSPSSCNSGEPYAEYVSTMLAFFGVPISDDPERMSVDGLNSGEGEWMGWCDNKWGHGMTPAQFAQRVIAEGGKVFYEAKP